MSATHLNNILFIISTYDSNIYILFLFDSSTNCDKLVIYIGQESFYSKAFKNARSLLHLRFRKKALATYSSPQFTIPLHPASVVLQGEKVHDNTMVNAPSGPGNPWYKSSKDVKDWHK